MISIKKKVCYFCGLAFPNLEECPYCEQNYCQDHLETTLHDCPLSKIQNPYEIQNFLTQEDDLINRQMIEQSFKENFTDFAKPEDFNEHFSNNSYLIDQIFSNVDDYINQAGTTEFLPLIFRSSRDAFERLVKSCLNSKDKNEYYNNIKILDILIYELKKLGSYQEVANVLNLKGSTEQSWGKLNSALDTFLDSIEYFEYEHNLEFHYTIFMKLGVIYADLQNFSEALKYLFKALEITHQLFDSNKEIKCLNNISAIYMEMGDIDTALGFFEDNLERLKDSKDINTKIVTLNHIGHAYALKGFETDAKQFFNRALKISQLIQADSEKAYFLNSIAMWHLDNEGDINWAIELLELAVESAIKANDNLAKARMSKNLGDCLLTNNEPAKALPYYVSALEIFERTEDISIFEDIKKRIFICQSMQHKKRFG